MIRTTFNIPALEARIPLTVNVTVIKKIQRRQANIISKQFEASLRHVLSLPRLNLCK